MSTWLLLIAPTTTDTSATAAPPSGAADLAAKRPQLPPLPAEPFDASRMLTARVDSKARICVRQCCCSVPVWLAGWTENVRLGATVVEVRSGAGWSPATSGPRRPGLASGSH